MSTSDKMIRTRKDYANFYGIDEKTFNAWLERADLHIPPGLISPLNQRRIEDAFGDPGENQES